MRVSAKRRKGYAHSLTARQHALVMDEPPRLGGADTGPDPQELLALSLASCAAVTVEMYAERKGWDVSELEVEVDYEADPKGQCSRFDVVMKLPAQLSDEQAERIRVIAAKCPVHRTLMGNVVIEDRVERR